MLYKYMTAKTAVSVLTHGTIRFTQPSAFNDPFEFEPSFRSAATQWERNGIVGAAKTVGLRDLRDVLRIKSSPFLFLCLTRDPNNLLMWSHYADSHYGIVIGFDDNHQWFQDDREIRKVRKVEYKQERFDPNAYVSGSTGLSKEQGDKVIVELGFVKSKAWEYEQEWRTVKSRSDPDAIELDKRDDFGHEIIVFPFPHELVKQVIVGSKMNAGKRDKIMALIEDKYPNAEIMIAERDFTEFSLAIKPYDPLQETLNAAASLARNYDKQATNGMKFSKRIFAIINELNAEAKTGE